MISNSNVKYLGKDIASFFREYDQKYSKQITIEQYIEMKGFDKVVKISIDYDKLISLFNQITGKKTRVIPEKVKKAIAQRLKEGFKKIDFKMAIINCYHDEYHKETNHKYLTLEFISRPDKLLKFSSMKTVVDPELETSQQRSERLLQKEQKQWG